MTSTPHRCGQRSMRRQLRTHMHKAKFRTSSPISPARLRSRIRTQRSGLRARHGARRQVALTGGTLSGDLSIGKANPVLNLNKTGSGQQAMVGGSTAGVQRWWMSLGDTTAESGGNAGSDLVVYRYADNGTYLGIPLSIARSNGVANFAVAPYAAGVRLATVSEIPAVAGSYLPLSGGTMTGPLAVNHDVCLAPRSSPITSLTSMRRTARHA